MQYARRSASMLGRTLEDLNTAIKKDIETLGVSRREAAELIGISPTTFHDLFVNTARPQKKTLHKISSAAIWSRETRDVIHRLERFFPYLRTGEINADANNVGASIFRIASSETLIEDEECGIAKKKAK